MQPDQAADYIAGVLTRNKVSFATRDDGRQHRILYGSTAIFVNFSAWGESDTVVNISALVLEQLDEATEQKVLERINGINCGSHFGKFCLSDKVVKVEHDLLASHLQPDEFMNVLGTLANHANSVDNDLQADLGGKTWEQVEHEDQQQKDALDT